LISEKIVIGFCFRLFPKGSDEVIDYQGERTLDGLSKFVDSNGKEAGKLSEEVNSSKYDSFFFSMLLFVFLDC
jgi:hypothetical protein